MQTQSWDKRGNSFGNAAETYDRTRPGYRKDALEWILGADPRSVLDLGAGTGLLSRALAEFGHQVTAVEPDDGMRERLAETTPEVKVLPGRAESIPLPAESMDAVLVGHAYHWFTPEQAHEEAARVLRPGGVFATLWNLRDEGVPWSAELTTILRDEDTGTDRDTAAAIMLHGALAALQSEDGAGLSGWLKNPSFGDKFGPIEQNFFRNSSTHTVETLIELVRSRSYYLTAGAERQAELESQIRRLATEHPDLAGRKEFELQYVTVVFRAIRSGSAA